MSFNEASNRCSLHNSSGLLFHERAFVVKGGAEYDRKNYL